jgi:hypothetical protein
MGVFRKPRPADEEIGLDSLPTEDIDPVALPRYEDDSFDIPLTADTINDFFANWNTEIVSRTNTGEPNEHAYYLDGEGNVIGIIEGTEGEVIYPREYLHHHLVQCHTHPLTILPSDQDIKQFEDYSGNHVKAVLNDVPITSSSDTEVLSIVAIAQFKDKDIKGITPEKSRRRLQNHLTEVYQKRYGSTRNHREVSKKFPAEYREEIGYLNRIDQNQVDSLTDLIIDMQSSTGLPMNVTTKIVE